MRPPFRNKNLNYLRSPGEAARACTRVSSDASLLRDCRACLRVGARCAFGRDDAGRTQRASPRVLALGNRRAFSARCTRGDDAGRTRRRARSCGELAKRWPRAGRERELAREAHWPEMTQSARGAVRARAVSALPRTFPRHRCALLDVLRELQTRRAHVYARELPPIVASSRQRASADASS